MEHSELGFFFVFLWVNPMGVGRASVYNNVSTSRGQWARAEPHNMEQGNTLLAAQRGPNTVGRWNTQTVAGLVVCEATNTNAE